VGTCRGHALFDALVGSHGGDGHNYASRLVSPGSASQLLCLFPSKSRLIQKLSVNCPFRDSVWVSPGYFHLLCSVPVYDRTDTQTMIETVSAHSATHVSVQAVFFQTMMDTSDVLVMSGPVQCVIEMRCYRSRICRDALPLIITLFIHDDVRVIYSFRNE
jgi:hypothetical protein